MRDFYGFTLDFQCFLGVVLMRCPVELQLPVLLTTGRLISGAAFQGRLPGAGSSISAGPKSVLEIPKEVIEKAGSTRSLQRIPEQILATLGPRMYVLFLLRAKGQRVKNFLWGGPV